MIKEFVEKWDANKAALRAALTERHPEDYIDLVKMVFRLVINVDPVDGDTYDLEKIIEINNGDYQGTVIYVIPLDTYQPGPDEHVYVAIGYGSCSGCDTLERIKYDDGDSIDKPSEQQISDYMTLCLHIIQKLKKIGESWEDEV